MTEQSHSGADSEMLAVPAHGLRWAIKTSFVGYVMRMSDGRAYVTSGAGVTEHNELVFPLEADSDPADNAGERVFSFGGKVTFTGHFGMLYVQIAHPRITIRDGAGELTVTNPESEDGERLPLATVELTGPEFENGTERWESALVRLTPQGVELFGDVYPPGEPLEPLTVILPAGERGSR